MIFFFVIYVLLLLAIGAVAGRKQSSSEDFLISNRTLGGRVAAFSSESTGMSGWLLLGLPGQIFQKGLSAGWAGWSCILGTFLNWKFIAPRAQEIASKHKFISIVDFLAWDDGTSPPIFQLLVRYLSAAGIIFFMTVYTWAQFVALGKALSLPALGMGLDYSSAVLIGASTIILYSIMGGFKSVVWTDLFQALIMAIVFLIVPIALLFKFLTVGPVANTTEITESSISLLSLFEGGLSLTAFMVLISGFGIGAAYTGQPQLFSRYMATKSQDDVKTGTVTAVVWVALATIGVAAIGVLGNLVLDTSLVSDPELIIFEASSAVLPAWMYLIVTAGVAAAVMSSADSFLIASATSISHDVPVVRNFASKLPNKTLLPRGVVLLIGLAALVLSYTTNIDATGAVVFSLASYAWGGLAIAFGIPVVYRLYSKRPKVKFVFLLMFLGVAANVMWHVTGLSSVLYEVIPIMLIQLLVWLAYEKFTPDSHTI